MIKTDYKKLKHVEEFEKRVKIEHIKLQIKHFIFSAITAIFAIMTWLSLLVIYILRNLAGHDTERKIIGIFVSLLYFIIALGLTMLFMDFDFNSRDDCLLVGYDRDLDCEIRKYRSEIMAERYLKKKGLIE